MANYPTQLDEIDQWLVDNFGIMPGACGSTENLRYNTAKMIAEALWPKCKDSLHISETCKEKGNSFTDSFTDVNQAANSYACTNFINNQHKAASIRSFKAGVKWQKKKDKEIIELAEDHAMLAGMVKKEEEMREKAIDGYVYESSDPASVNPGARLHAISIIYDESDDTPAILSGNKIKFYVFHDDKEK